MPATPKDHSKDSRTYDEDEFGQSTTPLVNSLFRGRFAPSPSGPLHFGSLIAAVGSYLIAKSHHAEWQVRIEDIDPPREIEGATETILHQLECFGLTWDGPVVYQSHSIPHFNEILENLKHQDLLYACNCTRKKINSISNNGRYPNLCQDKHLSFDGKTNGKVSWKLRHGDDDYNFYDHIQGHSDFKTGLFQEDFTVKRKDGLIAYQLAVVVDDIDAGIDHVVRGSDLFDSTPRQLRLYQLLGKPPPHWYHLPVAINQDGNKLSKQNHAAAIDTNKPSEQLWKALEFLGQQPLAELKTERPDVILKWAIQHFSLESIPRQQQIPYFE